MLVRGASLGQSMSYYLIEQIGAIPNIEVLTETQVVGVEGTDSMQAVRVRDTATGQERTLPGVAMFIFIGAVPRTDWLDGVVSRDHRGFILTGRNLTLRDLPSWPLDRMPYMYEASVPGVFAAGDVRYGSVKRVASAVGEGSIAVSVVHRYLSEG
jgi:thioredoxin reductase (NADPH)